MPSRRLDISSLLCDDDEPTPPIVPEPVILAPHLRLSSQPPRSHDPSPSSSRRPREPDPEPPRTFRLIDSPTYHPRPSSSSSSSRSPLVSYTYPPVSMSLSPATAPYSPLPPPQPRPPSSPYYQPSRHSPLLHRPSSSHLHQPQPQPRHHRSRSNTSPSQIFTPNAHPLGSLEALVQAATEERRRLSGDLSEPDLPRADPRGELPRSRPSPPPDEPLLRRSHPIEIVRSPQYQHQQPRLHHHRSHDRLTDDPYPRPPVPSTSAPEDFTLRSATFHQPPLPRHADSRLLLSPVESRTPARTQQYDDNDLERLRIQELDRQRRHHEQLLRQEQKQQQRMLEHQRAQEIQRAQELQRAQDQRVMEQRAQEQRIKDMQRAQEQRIQEQREQEQRAQEQRAQEQRAQEQRAQEERVQEQRVQEQRAQEQRAHEQRAQVQRVQEQRAHEQRAHDQLRAQEQQRTIEQRLRAMEQRTMEQRALELQAMEQRIQEVRDQAQRAHEQRIQEVLAQEQRAQEQHAQEQRIQEQRVLEQQRPQEQQRALLKTREQPPAPHIEAPHPTRMHLPPAARKAEPSQIRLSPAQIRTDLPYHSHHPAPRDDPRPAKKPRYSMSPSRPETQDPERIAKEREKMVVGELGYGRVEAQPHPQSHHSHPVAGPSSLSSPASGPRRPGSGNGSRRSMTVADLVSGEKEKVGAAPYGGESERPHRPVNHMLGRRSPPGSQAGRAMAARKSDDTVMITSTVVDRKERLSPAPAPPPPLQVVTLEQRQLPWERDRPQPPHSAPPKVKEEPFQSRPPSSNEVKPTIDDLSRKSKEPKAQTVPPRERPRSRQGQQQQEEDAHEWFLEHYADLPSPSARPEPPRSPSPSVSPVVPVNSIPRPRSTHSPSPPPHVKIRTPTPVTITMPDAAIALEQELEELVAEAEAEVKPVIVSKQEHQDIDMDLDVDLAVQELVAETMEDDRDTRKREEEEEEEEEEAQDVAMEVDVEDELLSLVDDRPPPPPSARRTNSTSAHGPASASSSTHPAKPTPLRLLGDAERHASPPMPSALSMPTPSSALLSPTAPRSLSARPASERGSMPPPASTSVSAASRVKEEVGKKGERATSIAAPPASKKKKEPAAKPGAKSKPAEKVAAKPRPKPGPKGKKGAADMAVPPPASVKASKSASAPAGKKNVSASRSRSASVMPGGSVGPDEAKAEKQEEEEDSDAANEDDKLYCVCKTRYDEDRFMIACDRCDEWYHTQCVDLPDLEVDLIDQFICPPCIEKNPHLSLRTTYKQRCLFGLKHPDPSSAKSCHKAARGAFSKYCSDECGVKYMQSRIDSWAKKGGKKEKLWESVKGAEKREGVVICTEEGVNGYNAMDVDGCKQEIVLTKKNKVDRETERLKSLLDQVMKLREEIKKGMEVVIWREKLLELASERAKQIGQCGWDQRLCFGDEEWVDFGAGVLESYEEMKAEGDKEDGNDMQVDGAPTAGEGHGEWWCPGNTSCGRHIGWQSTRHKDVCKEKEKKEEALLKLTTREREIRKRIEDIVDPHGRNSNDATPQAPLKSANTKLSNGHAKGKMVGDGPKKGKKRKAPAS